ncbi:MAG: RNA methyltransferase [Bacteroidales bacterium]
MISKNDIKFIRSLSQKKFRDEYGLFIVEGEKLVKEALESDFDIESVYYSSEIGEEAMSRISMLSSPSPAMAIIKMPKETSSEKIKNIIDKKPLALALESLSNPGNVGTIIRIADWFGIDAIFASYDTVDIFNPKVVQATMGAIFRNKFIYTDLITISELFNLAGMPVYGTFLEGDTIYSKDLELSGLIIMGSESNGISEELETKVTRKLYIPSYPVGVKTSESLNVAIATSIVCSEFRRNC